MLNAFKIIYLEKVSCTYEDVLTKYNKLPYMEIRLLVTLPWKPKLI